MKKKYEQKNGNTTKSNETYIKYRIVCVHFTATNIHKTKTNKHTKKPILSFLIYENCVKSTVN